MVTTRTASRAAAVLLLTLTTLVVGCGRSNQPTPPPCKPLTAPRPTSSPSVVAPDGGQLRVVEQGFIRLADAPYVMVGAIIENPTGHTAHDIPITVTLVDAAGGTIPDPVDQPLARQTIATIPAGGRTGFAAILSHMETATNEVIPPADAPIAIGASTWTDTSVAVPVVSDLALRVTTDSASGKIYGGETFTLASGGCDNVPGNTAATIFRDHTGTIIGGSVDTMSPAVCPAQPRTIHISLALIPPGIDTTRTTVYPNCG